MAATAPAWLEFLLWLLQGLQTGLLGLADALGLTRRLDGQPLWPLPWRFASEMLRVDFGVARRLALALAAAAVVALALLLALWRPLRRPALVVGALAAGIGAGFLGALLLQPSSRAAVLAEAAPTHFHRSPLSFDSTAVADGEPLYAAHCAACHGSDGRGEGPRAAGLPMWPPDLSRGLLWQKSDGELFWHVRHGTVTGRRPGSAGESALHGFADTLSDRDIWATLAYLQALAAGQSLLRTGRWVTPVPLPALDVDCGSGPALAERAGVRLRVVAGPDVPLPDPRLDTLLLLPPDADAGTDTAAADCVSRSAQAWKTFALIAGVAPEQLAGTQWIADRQGWLRALGRPPLAGWSDADMVCRSDAAPAPKAAAGEDGLGALIARMDAEPVRAIRGAYIH
ncbi:c-type cytochrome [Pseudothauera rhizosphaerae]|uniref:C-type cytochrome n=1 Tax=Pseudothauera rhizosphaerae TaxID=2565932 RepID=A0A4S4AYQ5_9RHOO|nr:c-type cytochrome [Pseudothauera rhizosphaerae]THF65278.1 c-type cytochrome [Pseudothauera rhizosphaerae]